MFLPKSQRGLFSFHISFSGVDEIGGELHFLEHMVFTKTSLYTRDHVSKKMSRLGVQDCFNACTSLSEIQFYGTYLEKDQEEIAHLLSEILFYPRIVNKEIIKEKKTVTEEWAGFDKKSKDFARELKKKDFVDISIIGTDYQDFDKFDVDFLTRLHKKVFNKGNMVITTCPNGRAFKDIILDSAPNGTKFQIKEYFPSEFSMIHPEAESNEVSIVFNRRPDKIFRYYKSLKNSLEGDIWLKLREKEQLFYSCNFGNGYGDNLSPFITLSFSTTEKPEMVQERLFKHLKVESKSAYENVCRNLEIQALQNKKSLLGFLYDWGGNKYGDLSFKDCCSIKHPSYEEVVEFGIDLKNTHCSTLSLLKKG